MVRIDREVGNMDCVAAVAPDDDGVARKRLVADDLLARLGRRDSAQDETQRPPPTNRRRPRRNAPNRPRSETRTAAHAHTANSQAARNTADAREAPENGQS